MNGSPLYRDTLAFCGILIQELEGDSRYDSLRRRLGDGALRMLDLVALALGGSERRERLEDLDLELRALRAQLHLAFELEVLGEDVFLALAEQADAIGRQVGGWLKRLRRQPSTGASVASAL